MKRTAETPDHGGSETLTREPGASPGRRYLGLDIGAETIKLAELVEENGQVRWERRGCVEHGKKPGPVLTQMLAEWDWPGISSAAVTGRLSRQLHLPQVPAKQALARGYQHLFPGQPGTVVSIGSHGFSVLEVRANGVETFRENSRCSQGTGNFLRQLVERFSLTIEEASTLCAGIESPSPLSGRCPVILKTDMTHLANKGEDRARILAGLFDAVCENVFVLIKPGSSPERVVLAGGVSRSPRVQKVFDRKLAEHGLSLIAWDEETALYLEALGSALVAREFPRKAPTLSRLLKPAPPLTLGRVPALAEYLGRVRRLEKRPWAVINGEVRQLILGFDIGSTGSKAVALDVATRELVWEDYRQTLGDPVGAAQQLLRQYAAGPAGHCQLAAFGVTGSGREIVGSLLLTCYGKEAVFVLNEIAAHATGALHFDPRVDTIFEIGGQDAKYIRLSRGRIIDCAMNEACSAGTGSFIEEQGRKFAGIQDIRQLGQAALAAPHGVSLGQHCSVFMAEIIDEAVAGGVESTAIIAGLYDSIVQNYLNRVKGNRSVGKVIFCQGMPFAADALAAAVARQTGSQVIVPPNPGTVGALGIALLAARELTASRVQLLSPDRFLDARLEQKDTFVCQAVVGCGGAGNHCRIDRLRTLVGGQRQNFTWGGGCALYDKGTRKKKLPDRAPDPFRDREELLQKQIAPFLRAQGRAKVALSDEFMLKGLFPFFAAFFAEGGLDLVVVNEADQAALKLGIQSSNVPFCAPMQLFHGLVERMAAQQPDYLFLPMVRSTPRIAGQDCSVTCPIVQASPDVVNWDLRSQVRGRLLSPVIDITQGNLRSPEFVDGCARLAGELGWSENVWRAAYRTALTVQETFDSGCQNLGRNALEFCAQHDIVPVIVLGRAYTIYNQVLNSNVPSIMREQGAIAIPVDCYPVAEDVPVFKDMYWGYGQQLLRAAHQIRRAPGVYSLYCSNYSCGPDSFNLHFAAYLMEGKPFAIIETDGHSGDAGTKTRVEAFLHCVEEDRAAQAAGASPNDLRHVQMTPVDLLNLRRHADRETILVPWMGPGSAAAGAVFRGLGLTVECLPLPDAEALQLGRRHTSGKECVPMCLTLGSLLQRLERATEADQKFTFLMPSTQGPCRLGVYNLLNQIILDRLGWRDRVRLWSPRETGYFVGFPGGTAIVLFAGFVANDMLLQGLLDTRPVEAEKGAAWAVYQRYHRQLLSLLEHAARTDLSLTRSLWQVVSGRLYGLAKLLEGAAADYAAVRRPADLPTVLVVGEIYVRSNDFSNDFVIEKLEARGLKVRLALLSEWLEYSDYLVRQHHGNHDWTDRLSTYVQQRTQNLAYDLMARRLDWPQRPETPEVLAAAKPYLREAFRGEAVLTLGGSVLEWRHGQIDAVVSVGPLECMPNKVAEAQFFHVAEQEGLLNLTLSYNGDPLTTEVLDNFAFEVHARFRQRKPKATVNDWSKPDTRERELVARTSSR